MNEYINAWLITVGLTCLTISACVSLSTQTAVSIDQFSATSAILTYIWLAVVNICEQIFLKMNCINNSYESLTFARFIATIISLYIIMVSHAKIASWKKATLLRSNIRTKNGIRILMCLWYHVCETWTYSTNIHHKIKAFEMWCYRRMFRIS